MNFNSDLTRGSVLGEQTDSRQMTAPDAGALPDPIKRSVGRPSKYDLGSGLIDQSQKATAAAIQIADK